MSTHCRSFGDSLALVAGVVVWGVAVCAAASNCTVKGLQLFGLHLWKKKKKEPKKSAIGLTQPSATSVSPSPQWTLRHTGHMTHLRKVYT